MPRLTVMMPARNAAKTIGVAIATTLRAMPSDSELVIVDDASDDRTAEIASNTGDRRVRVIREEFSLGGGDARRAIMRATDSEYVASMDADDICLPWRFRRQLATIANHDIVFGAAIWFGNGIRQLRFKSPAPFTNTDSAIALLFHCPFAHPSMLARRSSIELVGGYSSLRRAQDYELWLRSAADGLRLHRGVGYVIAYRQSPGQVIRQSGFANSLRTEPLLWGSYLQLVEHHQLPEYWYASSPAELSAEVRALMFADLRTLASQMTLPNRGRYARYARDEVSTLIGVA